MSDNSVYTGCGECAPVENIKEAVCINAPRIYDSCSDKDCLEDLPVLFTEETQTIIDNAATVRLNGVDVSSVSIGLQSVPFHKGFYAVDMTFYFDVNLDVYTAPNAVPNPVKGLAVFSKRAVLFGSDGSVKIFSSDTNPEMSDTVTPTVNSPKAVVQVAEPIPLSARLVDGSTTVQTAAYHIPESIIKRYGNSLSVRQGEKQVLVSVGIFTIVQLERNVQMLIPAYDFCIPQKECVSSSEDPCELFSSIDFPTSEFFPTKTIGN